MGNIAGAVSKDISPPTFKKGSFEDQETFRYLGDAKSFDDAMKKSWFISKVDRLLFDDRFLRILLSSESKGTYGGKLDFDMAEDEREQARSAWQT
jgi:hypothetical protein